MLLRAWEINVKLECDLRVMWVETSRLISNKSPLNGVNSSKILAADLDCDLCRERTFAIPQQLPPRRKRVASRQANHFFNESCALSSHKTCERKSSVSDRNSRWRKTDGVPLESLRSAFGSTSLGGGLTRIRVKFLLWRLGRSLRAEGVLMELLL